MIEHILSQISVLAKENILFFAILVASVIGKLKESSKKNVLSAWIVYFFGTVFHELSHFIISFLTFGKPVWISVIPSVQKEQETGGKSITLGYVKSLNIRWYNTFFISMAPLLLLPLSFIVYKYFFFYFEDTLLNMIIYIFIIVSLLFSSIPSSVDFGNFINKNIIINLFVPSLLVFLFYLYSQNMKLFT